MGWFLFQGSIGSKQSFRDAKGYVAYYMSYIVESRGLFQHSVGLGSYNQAVC